MDYPRFEEFIKESFPQVTPEQLEELLTGYADRVCSRAGDDARRRRHCPGELSRSSL